MNIRKKNTILTISLFILIAIIAIYNNKQDLHKFKNIEKKTYIRTLSFLKERYVNELLTKISSFQIPDSFNLNKFHTEIPEGMFDNLNSLINGYYSYKYYYTPVDLALVSDNGTVQSYWEYDDENSELNLDKYYEGENNPDILEWFPLIKDADFQNSLLVATLEIYHKSYLIYIYDSFEHHTGIDNIVEELNLQKDKANSYIFSGYKEYPPRHPVESLHYSYISFKCIKLFIHKNQNILLYWGLGTIDIDKFLIRNQMPKDAHFWSQNKYLHENDSTGLLFPIRTMNYRLGDSKIIIFLIVIILVFIFLQFFIFYKIKKSTDFLLADSTNYLEKQFGQTSATQLINYFKELNKSYINVLENIVPKWQIENLKDAGEGSENQFRKMLEDFKSSQNEKSKYEAELRIKIEELNFARQVQISMLPKEDIKLPSLEITGFMQTATEVGGDYYDFFQIDDKHYAVALGDATGHGVGAGLMVGMVKSALTQSLKRFKPGEDSLTGLMATMNDTLREALTQRGLGMCLSLSIINAETGELEVSSSGLPYPYHYKIPEKELIPVILESPPLGLIKHASFSHARLTLQPGDLFIGISDGLPERMRHDNALWGYEDMEKLIDEVCNRTLPPQEIIKYVFDQCDLFAGGRPNDDDMTVYILKMK